MRKVLWSDSFWDADASDHVWPVSRKELMEFLGKEGLQGGVCSRCDQKRRLHRREHFVIPNNEVPADHTFNLRMPCSQRHPGLCWQLDVGIYDNCLVLAGNIERCAESTWKGMYIKLHDPTQLQLQPMVLFFPHKRERRPFAQQTHVFVECDWAPVALGDACDVTRRWRRLGVGCTYAFCSVWTVSKSLLQLGMHQVHMTLGTHTWPNLHADIDSRRTARVTWQQEMTQVFPGRLPRKAPEVVQPVDPLAEPRVRRRNVQRAPIRISVGKGPRAAGAAAVEEDVLEEGYDLEPPDRPPDDDFPDPGEPALDSPVAPAEPPAAPMPPPDADAPPPPAEPPAPPCGPAEPPAGAASGRPVVPRVAPGANSVHIDGRDFSVLRSRGEIVGYCLLCSLDHKDEDFPLRKSCRWDCHFGERLDQDSCIDALLRWDAVGDMFEGTQARSEHKAYARVVRAEVERELG